MGARATLRHQPGNVLVVLVVHERGLDAVAAWPALVALTAGPSADDTAALRLAHVLVYDNSATPRAQPPAVPRCTYVHDAGNGGTAAAYRHAARLAQRLSLDWLLLLDHDTNLPADLLHRAGTALEAHTRPTPAALLPWVMHGARPVSPARITRSGTIRPLRRHAAIDPRWTLTAIASGAFLRVRDLPSLETIPPALWLDYVDHWLFAQLAARGAGIAIIDCALEHDLSVRHMDALGAARLQSILAAESEFVATLPRIARWLHPWRLAWRALRASGRRRDLARAIAAHALGHSLDTPDRPRG